MVGVDVDATSHRKRIDVDKYTLRQIDTPFALWSARSRSTYFSLLSLLAIAMEIRKIGERVGQIVIESEKLKGLHCVDAQKSSVSTIL